MKQPCSSALPVPLSSPLCLRSAPPLFLSEAVQDYSEGADSDWQSDSSCSLASAPAELRAWDGDKLTTWEPVQTDSDGDAR